jgi:DNA-binding PadR family transcriptional regulator
MNGVRPVVLGFLSWRPMSGYDVKRAVDRSTRFFWAASYGQIYPELRRLVAERLVEGESSPTGGRARTVHRLTDEGRAELLRWLSTGEAGYELRDVGLLKLFFSDAAGDDEARLDALRRLRADREAVLGRLREVAAGFPAGARDGSGALVLEYGIGMHEWIVGWCRDVESRLTGTDAVGGTES